MRPMITKNRVLLSCVFLTFGLLVACEPLAPEQTQQIVVVTGETPVVSEAQSGESVSTITPTLLIGDDLGVVQTGEPIAESTVAQTPTETPIPSATPYVCPDEEGQVLRLSFYSEVAGQNVSYRMYQPPCFYDTFQRYPYVILFHGTGYDEAMWDNLDVAAVMDQGIRKGTLPPMVLIMPDGGYLAELNDRPDGESFETVILDELMPIIESDFCLWGSASGRAIGGISRGGFWAFSIALRHPEMFSALGGHSPHFEPDNALPQYNPMNLAGELSADDPFPRIFMDNGEEDYVGANALKLSKLLTQNGIPHEYLTYPIGGHDYDYWRAHVAEYLAFYGQEWPVDALVLPSCLEPVPVEGTEPTRLP